LGKKGSMTLIMKLILKIVLMLTIQDILRIISLKKSKEYFLKIV
jgi:hypothetical protein